MVRVPLCLPVVREASRFAIYLIEQPAFIGSMKKDNENGGLWDSGRGGARTLPATSPAARHFLCFLHRTDEADRSVR
jgi:hypothetical protein